MPVSDAEYFGAPPQQAMQRAAESLWPSLRDDPRYAYEGRFVGLDAPALADVDRIGSLVTTQGGAASFFVDARREAEITAAIKARGFTTDRWDQLMTADPNIVAARAVAGDFKLPSGLTVVELTPDTPVAHLAATAAMALACGVLLPAGMALRGITRNSVLYLILNDAGEPVACSGAVVRHQAGSPFADSSWWGMLATREDMRGRGLSRYLGALAMVRMADRFGARRFYTGVRADNAVSQKLCRQLGLGDHGLAVMAMLDPARFGDVKLTR